MASANKPVPELRGEEAVYYEEARRGRLVYQSCERCGAVIWYPRSLCPDCLSDRLEVRASAGRGRVYSFTVVHRAGAPGYEGETPYTVALIDLDEGFRVMANILRCPPEQVRVGMPVSVVFEERAGEFKVPQFVPSEDSPR